MKKQMWSHFMNRLSVAKLKFWFTARSNRVIGLSVATLFAGIGVVTLLATNAQKIFIVIELDTGQAIGSAAIVQDASAAGKKYIMFSKSPPKTTTTDGSKSTATGSGSPAGGTAPGAASGGSASGGSSSGGSSTPVATAKPGSSNTGPRNPDGSVMSASDISSKLKVMTNTQVVNEINAGKRLFENVYITGMVTVPKSNVTFRNFVMDAGGGTYGFKLTTHSPVNTVMEDGEVFNFSSGSVAGANYRATRLNVHDSGGDAFKILGSNVVIENSWWHHLGYYPTPCTGGADPNCPHADGIQSQSTSASNVIIRGNNCDMSTKNLNLYHSNACFLGQGSDITFDGNWFNGGNYTIYCGAVATARVINNKFGRDYRYGLRHGTCDVWSGNTWEDTGEPA